MITLSVTLILDPRFAVSVCSKYIGIVLITRATNSHHLFRHLLTPHTHTHLQEKTIKFKQTIVNASVHTKL